MAVLNKRFSSYVSKDIAEYIQLGQSETWERMKQGKLTASWAREYIRALDAYVSQLYDSPFSPRKTIAQPSADDSMIMEEMREELAMIEKERSEILAYFGGVLPLDEDEKS